MCIQKESGSDDENPNVSTLVTRMSGTEMKEQLQTALSQANLNNNSGNRERLDSNSSNANSTINYPIANSIGMYIYMYQCL